MQTAQSFLRALTYLLHQSTSICLRIDNSATNRHFKNSIGNDSSPSPWHHGHAEKGIGDESSIPLSPFRDWSSPVMLCSRKVHSIIGDHPSRKLTELKRWALKHFPVLWELTFVVKTHWSRPSALVYFCGVVNRLQVLFIYLQVYMIMGDHVSIKRPFKSQTMVHTQWNTPSSSCHCTMKSLTDVSRTWWIHLVVGGWIFPRQRQHRTEHTSISTPLSTPYSFFFLLFSLSNHIVFLLVSWLLFWGPGHHSAAKCSKCFTTLWNDETCRLPRSSWDLLK